jgi:hypothetical protein
VDLGKLIGYVVIGFVLWTIWSTSTQPAPTVKDKVPVSYEPTRLHWRWKDDTDGISSLGLDNRSTRERVADYVAGDGGVLHQSPEQERDGVLAAKVTPDLYLGKWQLDVGPILAGSAVDNTSAIQAGIRYSPCRLAFGVIAPDIIATNDLIGAGVSLYPPERSVGPTWSHFGLGLWYGAPWDGGNPGPVVGLSASINLP